jgi:shikimate kinase
MSSIVLIGYRGSGKTTIGGRLAKELRRPFVDLDERIIQKAGMSIRDIFAKHGEPGFRQMETDHLLEMLRLEDHVISLGGGAVLAEQNRRAIKIAGHTVVYLSAEPEVLHRRIIADPATAAQRPGLTHLGGSVEEVRALLAHRQPLYRELKHIELDVNSAPTDTLIAQLKTLLLSSNTKQLTTDN